MLKKTLLSTLLLILLLPVLAFGEEVNSFTLPNGLTVLHMEKRTTQTIAITLLTNASVLQEPQGKEGVASLTAKSIMTGTKHRNFKRIIEDAANAGGAVDTSIGPDYSSINVSIVRKEAAYGFDLLVDILVDPTFSEESINRKKQEALAELGQPKKGFGLAGEMLAKDIFGSSPYGRNLAGTPASLSAITRDDVLSFYKSYYTPKNAVLVVVGAISLEELKGIAGPYMAEWTGETAKQPVQEKIATLSKKVSFIQRVQDKVTMDLGLPGVARNSADYDAVTAMNFILGGLAPSSRLTKAFQGETPFYPVYSKVISMKEAGYLEVTAEVNPGDVSKVFGKVIGQMEDMKKGQVSDEELKTAQEFLKQSLPLQLGSHRDTAEFIGKMWLSGLGSDYLSRYDALVDKMTKEDILRVAKKYLDTENYLLVLVGDKGKMDLSAIEGGKK
ncbi:MAG: pitrilysin family protein [Thermodesulfovibrionales bacterium]|jgi:zinc protease